MGYYITDHKPDKEFDAFSSDFLVATDEEVKIAELAFHVECDVELAKVKSALPEALANIVYKRFLVFYIRQGSNMDEHTAFQQRLGAGLQTV